MPHKSAIKSAAFSSSSFLPPHVGESKGLVCASAGKVNMMSAQFDSKQSWDSAEFHSHPMKSHCIFLQAERGETAPVRSGSQ